MAPILTNIENKISELIEDMTTEDGYNYSWGKSNVKDENIQDSMGQYPNAFIDEDEDGETAVNPEEASCCNEYQNKVTIVITARFRFPYAPDFPDYEIIEYSNLVRDDLKKLFGSRNASDELGGVGACSLLYVSSKRVERVPYDTMQPCNLESKWLLSYSQSMRNVEDVSC